MIDVGFKSHYRAIHFTSEIGEHHGFDGDKREYYINELYKYHPADIGFVHVHSYFIIPSDAVKKYPGTQDILGVAKGEIAHIKDLSFDIAVVHCPLLANILTKEILQHRRLVYVFHSFSIMSSQKEASIIEICKRADQIICISEAEKRKLINYDKECEHKITVIYPGFSMPSDIESRNASKSNYRIFGYIGGLYPREGLIECIRQFQAVNCELRVSCNYDPPKQNFIIGLSNAIKDVNWEARVRLYGRCYGERKERFFESLDALIIPSLYEPFGYLIIECVRRQIPVICSIRGGLRELIGDYKYRYNPPDPTALMKCIEQFQNDSSEEVTRQMNYLASRVTLFSAEKSLNEFTRLFDSLINLVLL